jgi:predicted GNAT family N-acyltransferase
MDESKKPSFEVTPASWHSDALAIAQIRRRVFIKEQGVPEALEWEARDGDCDWFVARAGEAIIGIARLTPDAFVGRMAVLPEWRGRGIGTALLRAVLQCARDKGLNTLKLHAQTHAVPFYARLGFRAEGEVFMEAGIPHRLMTLALRQEDA